MQEDRFGRVSKVCCERGGMGYSLREGGGGRGRGEEIRGERREEKRAGRRSGGAAVWECEGELAANEETNVSNTS